MRSSRKPRRGAERRAAGTCLLLAVAASCGGSGGDPAEWRARINDRERCAGAVEELVGMRTGALDILIALLGEPRGAPPLVAAELLGTLGEEALPAVPALIHALRAGEPGVRGICAIALGRIGDGAAAAVTPLLEATSDPDARVRVAAAIGYCGVTGDRVRMLPIVIDGALSGEDAARFIAVNACRVFGEPAIALLTARLGAVEAPVRAAAARALGELGPQARTARPAIYELLKDPDAAVRASAEAALDSIRED